MIHKLVLCSNIAIIHNNSVSSLSGWRVYVRYNDHDKRELYRKFYFERVTFLGISKDIVTLLVKKKPDHYFFCYVIS